MDLIKIGKFIAERRKKKIMTQEQLAEKLFITDRAVSKWERGLSLPDADKMLELCNILDINVNELLNGEKIDMKDYEKKNEELLLELAKQDEMKNKRLITDMWVMTVSAFIFYVALIIISVNLLEEGPLLAIIICIATVLLLTVCFYGFKLEVEAGYNFNLLCNKMCKEGYTGFEFGCGIPGTVGGAVYMNAGAYLEDVSDGAFLFVGSAGISVETCLACGGDGFRHEVAVRRAGPLGLIFGACHAALLVNPDAHYHAALLVGVILRFGQRHVAAAGKREVRPVATAVAAVVVAVRVAVGLALVAGATGHPLAAVAAPLVAAPGEEGVLVNLRLFVLHLRLFGHRLYGVAVVGVGAHVGRRLGMLCGHPVGRRRHRCGCRRACRLGVFAHAVVAVAEVHLHTLLGYRRVGRVVAESQQHHHNHGHDGGGDDA